MFLVALAAGVLGALFLSLGLGRLERPRAGPPLSQGHRNLLWFLALATTFVGPMLVLGRLFAWQHPGATLCTSLVGRWFFLPPVVLFVAGAICGARERKPEGPTKAA